MPVFRFNTERRVGRRERRRGPTRGEWNPPESREDDSSRPVRFGHSKRSYLKPLGLASFCFFFSLVSVAVAWTAKGIGFVVVFFAGPLVAIGTIAAATPVVWWWHQRRIERVMNGELVVFSEEEEEEREKPDAGFEFPRRRPRLAESEVLGPLGARTDERGFLRSHGGRLLLCVVAVVMAAAALPIMWTTWDVALMNTAFSFPVMALICVLVILTALVAPVHWWIRFRRFRAIGEDPDAAEDHGMLEEPVGL